MDRRTEVDTQAEPAQEAGGNTMAAIKMVCRRVITSDPAYYPQAEFHGRTIHFCTETCRSVFLSDPERFYAAHSRKRGDPASCKYMDEKDE